MNKRGGTQRACRLDGAAVRASLLFALLTCAGCKKETEGQPAGAVPIASVQPEDPASANNAAERTDCSGKWQLELKESPQEKESPLPHDSWCRAHNLPRSLTVEFQEGPGGYGTITGSPLKPTDILIGGGTCDFRFEGPTVGVPEHYTLIVEVPAKDTTGVGKGKCTAWGPAQDGQRTGLGLSFEARGRRQNE